MKFLIEKRNGLVTKMQGMLSKVKEEKRAFTEEENTSYADLEKEIKEIDATIAAEARARGLEITNIGDPSDKKEEKRAETERRAFENYIRGVVEERTDVNLSTGDNGAIIPSSIAKKIIKKVYDICPIYQKATRYNVGGTFNIPYYDEETQQITMAYADEFTELDSTSGKYTSITLTGYLAGALTKVSKSLINNSDFDIVSHVIENMANAISRFIEKELLSGTEGKVDGLKGIKKKIDAGSSTAVTADELIDLQEEVIDAFQADAVWIMNRATRKAIRKLKDGDGTYLLQKDFNAKWGYTLLGKDVYTSDNMPKLEAGKTAIVYGDLSGLAVKLSEEVNIQVLREKYATQHAIGVVGWVELDSKVENTQKLAKLVMKAL